ncbi:hypothetical protein J2X11_001836 [Aeromicrobium panaciterrae]|uniref:CcmD family protein n=1 Tax=Aeromicrobium panaciterrae TaxID=363861 RepID=A0ABU1UP92_9ACTN|nr:hypothetical protein [Aeromicrobium panaciterrae]MDR7086997.1 hypothetical protein [Aeromicrobium panaciterrae]
MNAVGKGIMAFFGGVGVLMVLVGREFEDRGGQAGDAASVFVLIGMIWTGVALLLLALFVLVGRSTARNAARQAEQLRDPTEGSDGSA